jgi:hypothetical protein
VNSHSAAGTPQSNPEARGDRTDACPIGDRRTYGLSECQAHAHLLGGQSPCAASMRSLYAHCPCLVPMRCPPPDTRPRTGRARDFRQRSPAASCPRQGRGTISPTRREYLELAPLDEPGGPDVVVSVGPPCRYPCLGINGKWSAPESGGQLQDPGCWRSVPQASRHASEPHWRHGVPNGRRHATHDQRLVYEPVDVDLGLNCYIRGTIRLCSITRRPPSKVLPDLTYLLTRASGPLVCRTAACPTQPRLLIGISEGLIGD